MGIKTKTQKQQKPFAQRRIFRQKCPIFPRFEEQTSKSIQKLYNDTKYVTCYISNNYICAIQKYKNYNKNNGTKKSIIYYIYIIITIIFLYFCIMYSIVLVFNKLAATKTATKIFVLYKNMLILLTFSELCFVK